MRYRVAYTIRVYIDAESKEEALERVEQKLLGEDSEIALTKRLEVSGLDCVVLCDGVSEAQ